MNDHPAPRQHPADRDLPPAAGRGRRYRWQFWIGGLVLLALAIPATTESAKAIASLRNLPASWLPETLPIRRDFFRFIEEFGITDLVLISWPDAKLDDPRVDGAAELLRQLCRDPDPRSDPSTSATEIAGQIAAQIRRGCGQSRPLMWVQSGSDLYRQLRRPPLSASHPAAVRRLSGSLVGGDDDQTCLLVSLAPTTSSTHRRLIPAMRTGLANYLGIAPEQVRLVGGPVDGVAVDRESIRSIERYSLPVMLLAALLCWIGLRSVVLTAVVVVVAMVGQGLVLAGIYHAGFDISGVLIVLPPLIFVLTISSGIHLCHYFFDALEDPATTGTAAAAAAAMRRGVLPCWIATATTVVGLASLRMVRLQPVWLFGIAGSIALVATLSMLMLLIPGAMLMAGKRRRPRDREGRRSQRWARRVISKPGWTIALFIATASAATWGLGRLRTAVSVPAMFRADSQLRQDYEWFENVIGPTMPGEVLLSWPVSIKANHAENPSANDESVNQDSETDNVNDNRLDHDPIDRLRAATRVHAALATDDSVAGILSPATFVPPIPTSGGLVAAGTRGVIRRDLSDPDSAVRRGGYVSDTGIYRIGFRLFQTGQSDFAERLRRIDEAVRSAIELLDAPERPAAALTGHVVIVQRTQEILLTDLFRSFLAAFGIITLVMISLTRSVVNGLLAMLANGIPTLLLFGCMGWAGTPLDIGSVMTASVALGIAVDDSVHFLSRFSVARRQHTDATDAAAATLMQCGPAMLHTTVVCGLSLLIYAASDFLPTRRFAGFMFLLLAAALAGVTLLLPALLIARERLQTRFARSVA